MKPNKQAERERERIGWEYGWRMADWWVGMLAMTNVGGWCGRSGKHACDDERELTVIGII